jgi:hypothetical protein
MFATFSNVSFSYDAIGMNVTDTASASDSKLLNLKVANTSMFYVQKDGDVFVKRDMTIEGKLIVDNANTDPISFTTDGKLLFGSNTESLGINNADGGVIQIINSGAAPGSLSLYANNDTSSTSGSIRQHRKTTTGKVSNDMALGVQQFAGYGDTQYRIAARIQVRTDTTGTISDSSMPGVMIFSTTPDGSTSATERLRIDSAGNIGIGTTEPEVMLDVNSDSIRIRESKTPASSSANGVVGEIAWDEDNLYICVANNTWKTANLVSF